MLHCLPIFDKMYASLYAGVDKKKKCVSGNRSENLGRVDTHIFFSIIFCNFFVWKKYNLMLFKKQKIIYAFQNA